MKKMMIIAVMIGAMLMPAQSFAQNARINKNEKRTIVENRKENRGGYNKKEDRNNGIGKNMNNKGGKHFDNFGHKPAPKPVVIHHHVPAPPPVVIRHHAPAPAVYHHHCNNDVVEAAAIAIGVAGIISLLAN